MELWVDASARVLSEQHHDEPARADLVDPVRAPARDRAVSLEPTECRLDSRVVRGEHLGAEPRIRRQCPENRDRLRGRERGIVAARGGITEAATDLASRPRMARVEHLPQLYGLDLSVEPDCVQSRSPPPSRWLVWIEVVVDGAAATAVPALLVLSEACVVVDECADGVACRLERRHPEHGRRPPGANALVCRRCSSIRD